MMSKRPRAGSLSYVLVAIVIALGFLLPGCAPSKQELKRVAAEKAIKSLRKVQAASQVGVTLVVYRSLLIDAQADVNEATRTLSPDGKVSGRLKQAMAAYVDAASFWDLVISGETFYSDVPIGNKMLHEYTGLSEDSWRVPESKQGGKEHIFKVSPKVALQHAWDYAGIHIRIAAELVEKAEVGSL